jgi:hypothetical protein
MGSLPFAFSVHHFINSVGADAGFAAIIGLAILILLYFAQARETANLRNHAHEAAQRIQELEARVAQIGRVQAAEPRQAAPAAQPSRVAAAAAPPISRVAAVGAPVGMAGPALAAATKLIPTPEPAAAPVGLATSQPPDATIMGTAETVGPPSTVAGGANGGGQGHAPPPPPVSAPRATQAPTQAPPPRVQMRPQATMPPSRRQPAPVRPQPARNGGSPRVGRILLAVLGVVALGGVIVLLVVLTSSNDNNSPTASSQSRTTNAPGTRRRQAQKATVAPSSVTVAVLNGTATAGLAHRVALKLAGSRYKEGTVATATDQTRTTTTVAYLPGFRRDALAVASSLKLPPSAVAQVDQPTQSVACPPPAACTANVVVTVGSDLANTQ